MSNRIQTTYKSRLEWLPVSSIETEPDAQRRFDTAWAAKIAAEFDPDLLGYPFVCAIEKRGKEHFYVIDGQHRVAATGLAVGPDQQIECEVVRGIDLTRAAAMFRGRNRNKQVRLIDKFLTGVTAKVPECVGITKVVNGVGLSIGPVAGKSTVAAVAALETLWRMDPEEKRGTLIRQVLSLMLETWDKGDPSTFNGDVIKGLGLVLSRYNGELDVANLRRRLAAMSGGALGLLGKGRTTREMMGGGMGVNIARATVHLYNRGRTKKIPTFDERP